MADIDFDELDKAVSSLMEQRGEPNAVPVEAPEPAVPTTTAPQSASTPAVALHTPVSPAIKRQGGRFMDVVHPSSNMRVQQPSSPAPSSRPSREASMVQPPTPSPVAVEQPAAASVVDESSTPSSTIEPQASLAPEEFAAGASQPPMQSPFLDDVEVDKRPLGASPVMGEPEATDIHAGESTPSTGGDMPDPIGDWSAPATPVATTQEPNNSNGNPEVKNDIWSAEKKVDSTEQPANIVPPELGPEVLALESDEASGSFDSKHNSVSDTTKVEPSVPGDIPRQYAAESADAPEPSAVFEAASSSPRELQHPEKKKSGWMVVIWILLLLVIGAGGGVAVWYFLLK